MNELTRLESTNITIQILLFSWRQKFRGVRGVLVTDIIFVNHEEKEAISYFKMSNSLFKQDVFKVDIYV